MTAQSGAALRIVEYEQAYDDEHHAYEARLVEARSAVARRRVRGLEAAREDQERRRPGEDPAR